MYQCLKADCFECSKDWAGWANVCNGLECEPSDEPPELSPQPVLAPVQAERRCSLQASSPAVSPPSADAEIQVWLQPHGTVLRMPCVVFASTCRLCNSILMGAKTQAEDGASMLQPPTHAFQ